MSGGIPIIDMSQPIPKIGADMISASKDMGFFYVKNHGIPNEVIEGLNAAMKNFFNLHEQEKLKYRLGKFQGHNGYIPMGGEDLNHVSGTHDEKQYSEGDVKENLDFECTKEGVSEPAAVPEGFQDLIEEYTTGARALADRILRAMGSSLEWGQDFFTEVTEDPYMNLRCIHYPGGVESEAPGCGEHTDYGFLTLLVQDEAGGLEVLSNDEWLPGTPIEGTIVVNVGDMLQDITERKYRSNMHRVQIPTKDRYSMPLFYGPNPSVSIKGINFGEFLEGKIGRTIV